MEITKEIILIANAREYYSSANREFRELKFNSSVVLYFKCLIALVDLYILKKTRDTPSSHSSRFRITQEKFPEIYSILDKNFPFYQDSYVHVLSKELAEVIKEDAEFVAKEIEVKLQ
jgi:5'(3')-deoxyribonucleotidase